MKLLGKLVILCVGLVIGFGIAWSIKPSVPNVQSDPNDIELVLVDLNEMRIMRDLERYRAARIAIDRAPEALNYSYFEDEGYASNEWSNLGDFLLLHPTAESGLYTVYRQVKYHSESQEKDITDFGRNFLISYYASAQNLALLEGRDDIYEALVSAQSCVVPQLAQSSWVVLAEACQPKLKEDVYRILNIDPYYVVEMGSSPWAQ